MKKIYFILSLLCLSAAVNAQTAASYSYVPLPSPFSSIAATGTPVPGLSGDDVNVPGIPIGFSFTYCGTPYTTLSACSNGWVSLTESPSTEWDNFEGFIDGPGWLMPFWDDLDGSAGTAYYLTTGTAPNRIFTFEWNNWATVSGTGVGSFQVRLYEGSNIIDFHYGPSTISGTDATIGISNDNISDWQTLADETPTPAVLASPAFETLIPATTPVDRLHRWTPSSCPVSPITGPTSVCTGGFAVVFSATPGCLWSSSTPSIATITPGTGTVAGITAGTTTISYVSPLGCYATEVFTVTATPPITGTFSLCTGVPVTYTHPSPGGTWTSSNIAVATVGAGTGLVTGVSPGTAKITYTMPGGCKSTAYITVNLSPAAITGTFVICQGSATTLSSTTPGGTWSSSFSSIATIDPSGVMTGVLGGVTTISYTLPSGCSSIASATVNPLPAAITGGTALCLLGTSLLSSTTFGGTWSSSVPAVATIDASGLVTGVGAGSSVISYILSSGCFVTTTVNVVIVLAPIVGPTTTCRLQSVTYSNPTPGGAWSSSTPAVGTINSVTGAFSPLGVGTTTISYTLGSGCFTIITVTVNANELITGVGSVCQGQTTTMSNALAGGTWASSDVTVFTVNSSTGLVTGVAGGTALISYTNTSGCVTTSVMTVAPTPSAISGSLLICVGNNTTLSSLPSGGTWSSSNGAVASIGASSGIAAGIAGGTSNIIYTTASGCTASATLTVNPTPAPISGVTVLCPATTAFLSQPVSGGTWTSTDVTVVTVGSSSGLITGISLAGGTSTITYTLPVSGCITATTVTVNPAPAPISGSLSVCVGANSTLSTASLGATWSSANVAVATIGSASGTILGVSSGTSTITCYGSNGCFRTVVVSVNPNPGAISGTATVCVLATTTLNCAPAGGAWSSSSGAVATVSALGVVSGVSANTVTISYTLLTGCFATRTVTVDPIPTPIGGNASVCLGLTTTLSSSPAGTWSSSATTATIGSSTGVVSGVAAGTSNITYTLPNGCFRTRTETVNPLPAAIGGSTIVCPGTNITLTNTSPGGTWSSSTPTVATVGTGTGVVTGVAGGNTTITYTLATGCIMTTTVTVISAPVAVITPIGDTVLCPGDFVTLTSSAAVGATYIWYIGGVPIPSATAPTYIASTAGSYQVRVSATAGCTTLSAPMAVSVVPATATITVPGGATTTCSGTPVTMNANTGAGLTYQWQLAGSSIAGATASTYNALVSGAYTVRVMNSAGCTAVSSPTTITVNPAPSNVVAISGPLTICNGSSVTFTASSGTGYTYQWYNSTGAITGATSMSYSATVAESYHVVITDGTGCTTTTATSVVVVNPSPNATITPGGPRLFCIGGSVTLDAALGFTYQWYRNGVAIGGATSASYTATLAGGYRVRVTNAATGCTAMTGADTVVTTVGAAVILPLTPSKFCWGGSSLLSTNISTLGSAVNYQWYLNGVVIPGATSPTYSATGTGDYSCRVMVPSSCSVTTAQMSVVEAPLPNPPITFNGTTFQTANYYITYQWYKNLIPIGGAITSSTPATSNGNYKVAVTDTNGCQSMSAVYVLTGWTAPPANAVVNVNSTDIKIFPNPAKMLVHIESAQQVRATVSGIDGRALINQPDAKDIDISKLADGVYMIMVYDNNNNLLKTEKLVKASE